MNRYGFALAALAIGCAAPAAALTGTAAWEFETVGGINSNDDWSFGAAFTVNTTVRATALGIFNDGTTSPNSLVNLYACATLACDTTGSLIASATVDSTGTTVGHFVFTEIGPVTLTTGSGYMVVGTMPLGTRYAFDNIGFATDSRINYTAFSDRYVNNLSADFNPTNGASVSDGYWGPNLLIAGAGVPEPTSWAMLIAGFGLIGACLRRRRAATAA